MTKQVEYAKAAVKALRSIPTNQRKTIMSKIAQLATDPEGLTNNVKALKGTDLMRLRVGDYRVIYTETLTVLTVEKVGHRKDIYD